MIDILTDERRAAHKEVFEQFLDEQSNREDSTSLLINRSKYNLIISYLNETIEKPDPSKKFYFKKQKFNIQTVENQPRLYREFKKRSNVNNLPVAVKEDYFEILYDIHSVQRGHIGINKMEHQLSIRFYGIPRNIVAQFIKFCPICNLKLTQMTQPRIKPIRSNDFFSRVQIDLIDMRHRPAKHKGIVYQWIAHVMDHFTKIHIIWAQEHKCAEEVAEGLERFVFSLFGLPAILQADNGTEFKNALQSILGNEKQIVEIVNENNEEIERNVERSQNNEQFIQTEKTPGPLESLEPVRETEQVTQEVVQISQEVVQVTVRDTVRDNQEKAAKKMEEKHNKKRNKRTLEFVVSDKVSVLIPRIDRGGSDLPRLPGIIARVSNGGEFYEIITEHGILKDCLRACDLEMYHGQLSFDYSTITNQISLREAARKTNKRDKDLKEIEISCQCNGTCTGGKCKCFISGVKCNSHCHLKSVSKCCKNKD